MKKGRILVVDDDPDILFAYRRTLEKEGYKVETASNFDAARQLALKFNPDLMFVDVVLSEESGFDLIKEFKSNHRLSHIFMVLISGNVKSSDKQSEGLELGADGYILKPIKSRELLARADSFIKHKHTIDQLKDSEDRFKKIVNRNVDGILIINYEGKTQYANPSAAQLFNKDNHELFDYEFGYPVVTGENYEINIKTNSGFDRIAEMRTTGITWDNKSMVLASLRDVTERTQAEMRLQLQNDEIKRQNEDYKSLNEEYMVTNEELIESYNELREVNRELSKAKNHLEQSFEKLNEAHLQLESQNIELEIARKKADESNLLKSNFLAGMAHELRTPLNAIIGFSEMITSELEFDELSKFSGIIHNNANNLLNIIDDTFSLALIDSGQAAVRKENFYIKDFFDQINLSAEQLFISFNKKEIELEYFPDEKNLEIQIYADKGKLMQIMLNLLKNAFKFTQKGSIKYGYYIEDEKLLFFIEDTGIGIQKEKTKTIFERFQQLDDTKHKSIKGAGLGLAISKELAEILGAEIWVESEYKKGSKFYVRIPFIQPKEKVEGKDLDNKTYIHKCLERKSFLIVEDDETNYLLLKSILKSYDVKLEHAWNGKQALNMFAKSQKFDFILMDLRLPYVDGFEATREIRSKDKVIPIIAVTAYAFKNDIKKAMDCGCNDVLVKPIRKKAFLAKLMEYCLG